MLRDRNVRMVVAARFISRVGGEAAFFVGIWGKAAYDFDAGPVELAVLMGAIGGSSLAGSAVGGVLVDRYDPRRVLLVGEVVFVPATLAILLAGNLAQMTLLSIAFGFASAPIFTAVSSFAPYLTRDEAQIGRINSLSESAGMLSFVVGPAAGAVVVRYASVDWIFVLDAATSLVAVALVAGVTLLPLARTERTSAVGEMVEGLGYAYRVAALRFLMLAALAIWLTFGAFAALEPLFYRDVLEVDIETLGWVNAVFGMGLAGGALLSGRVPPAWMSARSVALAVIATGGGAVLYVGTDRLWVVVVGAVVWGTVIGTTVPILRTLVHLNSPEPMIGRISGTFHMHSQVGQLLPLTFVPALASVFPVQVVLVASGMALAALGLLAVPIGRAIDRDQPATPAVTEPFEVADQPISPNP